MYVYTYIQTVRGVDVRSLGLSGSGLRDLGLRVKVWCLSFRSVGLLCCLRQRLGVQRSGITGTCVSI